MSVENRTPNEIPSGMVFLQRRMPSEIDGKIPFAVIPSTGFQRGIPKGVVITNGVLNRLILTQMYLDESNLLLVLKRGYIPKTRLITLKQRFSEMMYGLLKSPSEAESIFKIDYGHYMGTGVDLGIYDNQNHEFTLSFLPPFNVFSPQWWIKNYMQDPRVNWKYGELVNAVTKAGFKIHPQVLEAKQMHCYI